MAFSMFLRSMGGTNRIFSQQLMRLATQPSQSIKLMNTMVPIRKPILEAVRSFRTTCVRMSEKPHDHSKLWIAEKGVAAALLVVVPVGLFVPCKLFDTLMAILIVAHSHWGWEAIAVDYVRAAIFGPIIPKIAVAMVYLISIVTLGGLFYLIGNDIGIANTIRSLWAIKSEKQ